MTRHFVFVLICCAQGCADAEPGATSFGPAGGSAGNAGAPDAAMSIGSGGSNGSVDASSIADDKAVGSDSAPRTSIDALSSDGAMWTDNDPRCPNVSPRSLDTVTCDHWGLHCRYKPFPSAECLCLGDDRLIWSCFTGYFREECPDEYPGNGTCTGIDNGCYYAVDGGLVLCWCTSMVRTCMPAKLY